MHRKTLLWVAAATLLCAPVVLAQSISPVVNVQAGAAQGGDVAVIGANAEVAGQQVSVSTADGVSLPVLDGQVVLPVGPLTLPGNVQLGDGDQSSQASDRAAEPRSRPWSERAAKYTEEAGKTAGAVVLLTAVASLFEGVRTFAAKAFGGIGRRLFAVPIIGVLFSRIASGKVLENAVRSRVREIIVHEPGLALQEVRDRAGIAWGTAVHHLRRLEQHGLVISVRQGGHRRFFDAKAHNLRGGKEVAALMQPTARRVAELVSLRPGINQAGLCQELGMRNPSASKHLGHFETLGLVTCTPAGRSRLYHPTDALTMALRVLEPAIIVQPTPAVRLPKPLAATA